ncbi:hypothetical protein GCM10023148_53130 [Actinokineospora soli]
MAARPAVVRTPVPDRPDLELTRYAGHLVALSIASGAVAGVALLDAIRNLVLASRKR